MRKEDGKHNGTRQRLAFAFTSLIGVYSLALRSRTELISRFQSPPSPVVLEVVAKVGIFSANSAFAHCYRQCRLSPAMERLHCSPIRPADWLPLS